MLSQKIPLVILHRLVFNLTRKNVYLKSEIAEIGRLWAISGLFLDSSRFRPYERQAGLSDCARGGRRGLMIARGDGWGLFTIPEAVGGTQ